MKSVSLKLKDSKEGVEQKFCRWREEGGRRERERESEGYGELKWMDKSKLTLTVYCVI